MRWACAERPSSTSSPPMAWRLLPKSAQASGFRRFGESRGATPLCRGSGGYPQFLISPFLAGRGNAHKRPSGVSFANQLAASSRTSSMTHGIITTACPLSIIRRRVNSTPPAVMGSVPCHRRSLFSSQSTQRSGSEASPEVHSPRSDGKLRLPLGVVVLGVEEWMGRLTTAA